MFVIEYRQAWRRHSARGLTRRKMRELTELADRWGRARRGYIRDDWGESHFLAVLRAPRSLVEQRRNAGWSDVPIMVHYHKTALDSALDHVRRSWALTVWRVRGDVRASGFSDN